MKQESYCLGNTESHAGYRGVNIAKAILKAKFYCQGNIESQVLLPWQY